MKPTKLLTGFWRVIKQWGLIDNNVNKTLPINFSIAYGAVAIPRSGGTDWAPYILSLTNTTIKVGSPQNNNFYFAYGRG